MKQSNFVKRLTSLLLVVIMLVTLLPLSSIAAMAATKDDIVTNEYKGVTGFKAGTLNQNGNINWPVKIYDNLSDGMLFEFAQYQGSSLLSSAGVPTSSSDTSSYTGGQYVLGNPMPYGGRFVTDYTTDAAYSSNAYAQYAAGRGARYTVTNRSASNYNNPRYITLKPKSGAASNANRNYYVSYFRNDNGLNVAPATIRYMVIVYRSSGMNTSTATDFAGTSMAPLSVLINRVTNTTTSTETGTWLRYDVSSWTNSSTWTYRVIDLVSIGFSSYYTNGLSITPNFANTSAYMDISHVAYFTDTTSANTYGNQCIEFMKAPGEYISGTTWNIGNNTAYGMLYSSNGEAWGSGGGASTLAAANGGYYTYQIGYRPSVDSNAATYNDKRLDGKDANGRFNGTGNPIGDNGIHYVSNTYGTDNTYDMRSLDFGGYQLLETTTKGGFTAGLLESTLGADGTPQYKQDTIEYIADLLSKTLTIPQKGSNGNNNYTYVAGVKNAAQYGTTNGTANDLAQGLRNCLGITFSGNTSGTTPKMGTYAETMAKADDLKGAFLTVAGNGKITTCMDAAYYLLHNLFVADSYNQLQNDFQYFTLSSATLDNGTEAFIFDGGFSYGASLQDLIDGNITQAQYKAAAKNAVVYSSYHNGGNGTISHEQVDEKDLVYYANAEYARTTRFPFLPVVNPDENTPYAGETRSYYFAEDGKRSYNTELGTYRGRNYGYTLASNGEFVFNEEDELYFEFEGDDDVYLFINNQLVLDIGAGHSISNASINVNEYVAWAREVVKNPSNYTAEELVRAQALDLEDGEIASFDFYYMERHGYGANCRIVTNMHVTDPSLRVDKSAYQGGKEIEYGGIVDADKPIAYNFTITNSGNQKLYNLSLDDKNIGVSLTPENGLYVAGDGNDTELDDINGYYVTDARGEKLDATDIVAYVSGWEKVDSGGDYIYIESSREYTKVEAGTGTHIYHDNIEIRFNSNDDLKKFLKTLESAETDNSSVGEELTQKGAGLWVDASVTFTGIYYTMTDEQSEEGVFNNTVYAEGITTVDPDDPAAITKVSEARHRVYVTAIPCYYQWAGKDLFISKQRVLDDASAEAGNTSSMLHDYIAFFNAVGGDITKFGTVLCDRLGHQVDASTYPNVVLGYQAGDGQYGYKTNYDTPGIYEFHILMYLYGKSGDIETMNLGEYAVVRVLIIVTDVGDAQYVLDYGLATETLDKGGELFKGDELLGDLSGTEAKVMGITGTQPSYLNVTSKTNDYNRIDFSAADLASSNKINTEDGYYTANIAIGDLGKKINYDKNSGRYTIVDSGTVTVHVDVPVAWDELFLYYWYDDGRNNVWPGDSMTMTSHGNFELTIPDNVPHVIISNGTNQTVNLDLTPGKEVWIDIDGTLNADEKLYANVTYKTTDGVIHAKVPEGWGDVYIYCWDSFGNGLTSWPGIQVEEIDSDGFYTYTIPADITNVIVNNGDNGKQTSDLVVYAGSETWITVNATPSSTNEEAGIDYYGATSSRSTETIKMHASVPDDWQGASVYYWNSNGSATGVEWPGIAMTKGTDGLYHVEGIPADVTNVIINDGKQAGALQTQNLSITPGAETWFTITAPYISSTTTVEATVPADWSEVRVYFFNDSGTVGTDWPGITPAKGTDNTYSIAVPDGATKYIVNNNNNGKQTQNLFVTRGIANKVEVNSANVATPLTETTIIVSPQKSWRNVNIHYWNTTTNVGSEWPGVAAEMNEDGTFTATIPAGYNAFLLNNGIEQTGDIFDFYMGGENLVTVYEDLTYRLDLNYKIDIVYGENADKEGFTFTPTDFMDSEYNIWMAITVHETDINVNNKPTALGSAVNIGKEVQMYKKITVLPANVVYYEDDFAGIVYDNTTSNVINHYGDGSGSLGQSVDQNQQYGKDSVYQGSENDEMTGGSLTDVYINDSSSFARFWFTGTGFEIIGHTHAEGSGTLRAYIYDSNGKLVKKVPVITEFDNGADGGKEGISAVPLIRVNNLEFGKYKVELSGIPVYDMDAWDGKNLPPTLESYVCIDGVRIFQPLQEKEPDGETGLISTGASYTVDTGLSNHVTSLTDGVYVTGNSYYVGTWMGFNKDLNVDENGQGVVTLDLGKTYCIEDIRANIISTITSDGIGNPTYVEVYYANSLEEQFKFAGNINIETTQTDTIRWCDLMFSEGLSNIDARYLRVKFGPACDNLSWVMVDEIEVYGYEKGQVENGSHDAYLETEDGAYFEELRNFVADRKSFAIKYDDNDGLSVSGGTSTWIENRNNSLPSDFNSKWTNNIVNSANDYLIAGPNNEVYVMETTEADKSALVFYVRETADTVHNLQLAIRALDYGAFMGSEETGNAIAEIQYGVYNENGEFAWKTLTTTVSSAEQYFTVPYTECPYDAENDRYQVVIRVADTTPTGMASFTSVKFKGIDFLELNTSEVPDVIYSDEVANTIIDSNGNTLETSKFVDFLKLAGQMESDDVVEPEDPETPEEPVVIEGVSTSAMGALYDSFTADTTSDFAITETSRFYIVTPNDYEMPSESIQQTVKLAQSQFKADNYDMEIVWGLEEFSRAGDIIVYVDSSYTYGAEGYNIEVSDRAVVKSVDTDGLLYGLNTLQKHFRYAGTNAIEGFTLTDAPDTKERTVHLDIARKYLTPEFIKNYIAEMSWMGYNAIELHFSEDVGFRANFWDGTSDFVSPTGNDFSWCIGSAPQYWNKLANGSKPDVDQGRYLSAAELIDIFDTCAEYHIEVIPSFDSPGHVDWISKNYYANHQGKTFKYEGVTYTLPSMLNSNNTVSNFTYSKLNIGNETIRKFSYALYTDIGAFFKQYAGSTKFNIGGDEIELESITTWTYTDFINYMNNLNSILKEQDYTVRMYNDCVERTGTGYETAGAPELDEDIEIVFWSDDNTAYKSTSSWISDGRTMYNGLNYWTYYALRILDSTSTSALNSGVWGFDARNPLNKWWSFYRNQEDLSYAEWNPARFNGYKNSTSITLTNDQLAGGYFMVWCDYMSLNTEAELWQGVWDDTYNYDGSKTTANGNYFYSLIDRMWSNAEKQWNWDINNSLEFDDYETLRDKMGFFPGYDTANSTTTSDYMSATILPESAEISEESYYPTYKVTFKNYDGTVLKSQYVYHGSSATAPAVPERPDDVWYTYKFAGWDKEFTNITADTVLTATYTSEATVAGKIGYLEVKVSGGTNFNISINDETPRPMGTKFVNASMEFGKKVVVTAETTNGNRFIGWVSAKTGDVLSTERTYTFYTSGNDVLIALFDTDLVSKGTVTFRNDKTNQIIDIQYYASGETIIFPEDVTYAGYKFVGWSLTEAEIQARLSEGKDVTVYPEWEIEDQYFSITVEGGYVSSHGGMKDGKYVGYKGTTITAKDAPNGKTFAYWEDQYGDIVSYDADYKFYPFEDCTYTAVYVINTDEIFDVIGTYEPVVEEEPDEYTFRVYFKNNWKWTEVSTYYWGAGEALPWPGAPMTLLETEGTDDIYFIDLPVGVQGFVINGMDNGSANQTPDITEFVEGRTYSMAWNSTDGNVAVIDDSRVEGTGELKEDKNTIYISTERNSEWSASNRYVAVYAAVSDEEGAEGAWYICEALTFNGYFVVKTPVRLEQITVALFDVNVTTPTMDAALAKIENLVVHPDDETNMLIVEASGGFNVSNMITGYFLNSHKWTNFSVYVTTEAGANYRVDKVLEGKMNGYDLYGFELPDNAKKILVKNIATGETFEYTPEGTIAANTVYGFKSVAATIDTDVVTSVYIDTLSRGDANTVYFSWSVPETSGCTFVNAGVLLVKEEDYNEDNFALGTIDPAVIQFAPARKYQVATGVHSVTIPAVVPGDAWIACSFVQYRDEQGKLQIKYSKQVTGTK